MDQQQQQQQQQQQHGEGLPGDDEGTNYPTDTNMAAWSAAAAAAPSANRYQAAALQNHLRQSEAGVDQELARHGLKPTNDDIRHQELLHKLRNLWPNGQWHPAAFAPTSTKDIALVRAMVRMTDLWLQERPATPLSALWDADGVIMATIQASNNPLFTRANALLALRRLEEMLDVVPPRRKAAESAVQGIKDAAASSKSNAKAKRKAKAEGEEEEEEEAEDRVKAEADELPELARDNQTPSLPPRDDFAPFDDMGFDFDFSADGPKSPTPLFSPLPHSPSVPFCPVADDNMASEVTNDDILAHFLSRPVVDVAPSTAADMEIRLRALENVFLVEARREAETARAAAKNRCRRRRRHESREAETADADADADDNIAKIVAGAIAGAKKEAKKIYGARFMARNQAVMTTRMKRVLERELAEMDFW
ncbi:hypothetical protein ColLi_13254 [Colletotrichum liriopes]|uniref:Uncharacterized protein n=1 Tax=Colletotrichum liriopes TaxID=708192 RepID=A0AA37M0D1_9PEZI|nr:hypothetical protein ColLi_13254 [Colletotrichum liriopes]